MPNGFHMGGPPSLNVLGPRLGVDLPPFPLDRLRQRGEVLERMKLSLVGKSQAGAGVESRQWRARHLLHADESRAMRGSQLAIGKRLRSAGRQEEVAVHPGEVAVD